MVKREKRRRLIEVVASQVGFRDSARVMVFIACWGIASEKLGRPPETIDEYSEYWGVSRATGFREQSLFRSVLPEHETPTAICEWLRGEDPAVFDGSPEVAMWRVGALL